MNYNFALSAALIAFLSVLLPSTLQSQNALNFDGTNDFVQTTYGGILGSANRTFEAWVLVSPGATANTAIMDYGLNAVGSRNTFLVNPNNQLAFISGGTNANISSSSNAVPTSQWTHVAFVLNSGTGFLYVNGIQVGTGLLTTVNTPAGNANLRIGQRVAGGTIPFEGAIDEVRVWNYARTPAEIMNDMNGEFCTIPTGLMAYYQFNEGVAAGTNTSLTNLPDFSGNANNGTLNNFTLTGTSSNWVSGASLTSGSVSVVLTETACAAYTSPSGNYVWTTSGTYQDTISAPGGCDSTFTIQLIIDSVVANFSATSPTSLCLGDSVSFMDGSTGGNTYSWFADATLISQTNMAGYTFADTGLVEVMLIVSNPTCSDTSSMNFSVSGPIVSSSVITDESCPGSMDGAIDLDVEGGSAPYQYVWSTGDTTQDLNQLVNGTYSLSITDSQGCLGTFSFPVSTALGVSATFSTSSDPSLCPGETINFTNTSQLASAYEWQNDGQPFSQNTNASYTFPDSGQVLIELVATEGNCSDSTSLLFTVNAAPQVEALLIDESCPASQNGSVDLELLGGSAPFTFLWSNSATTEDLSGLSMGSYDIAITDSANCTSRDTFQIETLGGAQAAFSHDPVANGVQFTDESLGDSIISWHWVFGTGVAADTSNEQSPAFEFEFFGTYQVCLRVEDLFGCVDSLCQEISYLVSIDPALYQAVELYPNPNNGLFYIDLSEIANEQVQLAVFDALGKQVYASRFRAKPQSKIDLSDLSKGVYHLRVVTEKGYYQTKVVVE